MKTSIAIVTRNRADELAQTLASMGAVRVPDSMDAELTVIDNGSSDHTHEVVASFKHESIRARCIREERPGLSNGRNRALLETDGNWILFTDDDVRVPENWLEQMISPMAAGKAEAVCGGVRIADELNRPWMTPIHRSWLASTECLDPANPGLMIGANMALSRHVLERVPGFDEELGAGALGSGEETLFSLQLTEAGYRIHGSLEARVVHHFQKSRLERNSWLDAARKMGASQAYIGHHWKHWQCRMGALKLLKAGLQHAAWRFSNGFRKNHPVCGEEELRHVFNRALVEKHVSESRRPRNYERHGLIKQRGPSSE